MYYNILIVNETTIYYLFGLVCYFIILNKGCLGKKIINMLLFFFLEKNLVVNRDNYLAIE